MDNQKVVQTGAQVNPFGTGVCARRFIPLSLARATPSMLIATLGVREPCNLNLIFSYAACTLDVRVENCKLRFSTMATQSNPLEQTLDDFQFPQREAAFFYGLFLRGHSAEELRKDIQVPAAVLAKWDRETVREPQLRPILETIVRYRQHVLAIFENLICHDATTQKLQ